MMNRLGKQTQNRMTVTRALGISAMVLVGVCLALVSMPGCSSNPAAPQVKQNGPDGLQWVENNFGDAFNPLDSTADGAAAKHFMLEYAGDSVSVGHHGGTIELKADGIKSVLRVPEDALSEEVTISAEFIFWQTPWGDVAFYDFEPEGLVFNTPAELTLSVPNVPNHTVIQLFWFNPETGDWEHQQESTVRRHKAKFEIHHFSKYGLSFYSFP